VVALAGFHLQGSGEDAPAPVQTAPAAPAATQTSPATTSGVALAPVTPERPSDPPAPASEAVPSTPRSPSVASSAGERAPSATPTRSRSRRGRSFRDDFDALPSPSEWVRPEGPVRIAVQAGHWKAAEAPDELSGLRNNGAMGGGKHEWEVNLEIARRTAKLLEEMGYQVEILPATIPPSYLAHLFISIHADGAADPEATGYRVAAPRRDATGRAGGFVELLERTYAEATGLKRLPTVTRRMQNYYAFNARRYEHALNPRTISVIIETGFLTSAADRRLIVNDPDRVARGIAEAVRQFPETPPPNGSAPGR
jgi:N-acetylmuramoyl-L-alanine amidase